MTIPKKVTKGADLVVMPKAAYDHLRQHLAEVEDALQKIQQGEKEFRQGKTKVIKSLEELE